MGYPRSINLGAQTYEVSVERDSEGSIQYFQLLDSQGEIFFETDWEGVSDVVTAVGSCTADQIPQMLPQIRAVLDSLVEASLRRGGSK